MNKETKCILILLIACSIAMSVTFGIVIPGFLLSKVNKAYEKEAKPYFEENEELQKEIGKVIDFKCLGRESVREEDGLPVWFEVKAEKGKFYIRLWYEIVAFDPDEYVIVKHRIETDKPDFFR